MSDALEKLHTTLLDTRAGYEAAERDAKSESLRALFKRMIELHERNHGEVHSALAVQGKEPDDSGSLMASVHKAAVGVRAAVTGIDRSALGPFISGEEQVVKAYDAALAEPNATKTEMLRRQKADVVAMIEAMRAFKA